MIYISNPARGYRARFPERSKGRDLRSRTAVSWVRIPHLAKII